MKNNMKKQEIFFDSKGLTSTSANHIANLTKEYYQGIEKLMTNIQLFTTTVKSIESNNTIIIKHANHNPYFSANDNLEEIANCKSLIAWLREAIKARKELIDEINNTSMYDWCIVNGFDFKVNPIRSYRDYDSEYIASLSIKDRCRYYELETKCAVFGKYIHEGGGIAKARQDYSDAMNNPVTLEGSGRDTLIYRKEANASFSYEGLHKLFFELQNKHREYQAELNTYKFNCDKYSLKQSALDDEQFTKELLQYNRWMSSMNDKWMTWKKDEIAKISNLKIIIPNSLNTTYEMIKNLGK